MKKKMLLISLLTVATSLCFTVEPLENKLPEKYVLLRDTVYGTTNTESEVASFYDNAVTEANSNYKNEDLHTLLALCLYMKGMDYYYKGEEKKAGDCFDSGIDEINKSFEIKRTAIGITAYTKILLQNSSVKSMTYGLKWVPKITSLCDEAISLNSTYTPSYQMKYAILCIIPSPYGNYKKGSELMLSLNDEKWKKEKDDYFSIATAAAYAFSKTNQKDKAILWYKKGLEYYPNNSDCLKQLQELEK